MLDNTTAGARGTVLSDGQTGAYLVESVRVNSFLGVEAVGVRCAVALKSLFTRVPVELNSTNLLLAGTAGFPTTLRRSSATRRATSV